MTWTDPAYEAVARLVGARTGLAFPPDRRDSAEQGIRHAMARAGAADPARYRERVAADPGAFDDLVAGLTVGETYFFREPDQFRFIRRRVLPDLRGRKGPGQPVRAWSAGCASGEEAYSLAILLEEEGLGERAHLLATDISSAALARARDAVYTQWSLRGEGAAARPYLSPRGNRLVLDERIRRQVTLGQLNLALDVYPSYATGTRDVDLILCRNVLIYLDPGTVRSVAGRLFEALAPGGWLITASSDPPLSDHAPFETVVTDAGVFYRRDRDREVLPPARPADGIATASGLAGPAPSPPEPRQAPVLAGEQVGRETRPEAVPSGAAPGTRRPLDQAREALAGGDYARAVALARGLGGEVAGCVVLVRAQANLDPAAAERACADAAARHPLSPELHYLHAVLLLDLGRSEDAARAARRVIYLDRSQSLAHFTLGSILQRRGELAGALRAYRNARDLCASRPADEVVPLSDGERAGRLTEAAGARIAALEEARGVPA